MNERPNYYLLLDLDPAIEDEATIAKKIQEKKLGWSKKLNMGNPAHAAEAKANIARLPDIQRVMGDSEERRKEAGEAQKQKKEYRRVALEQLESMIKVLRAKGETCAADDCRPARIWLPSEPWLWSDGCAANACCSVDCVSVCIAWVASGAFIMALKRSVTSAEGAAGVAGAAAVGGMAAASKAWVAAAISMIPSSTD